jgi:hypothetical protein
MPPSDYAPAAVAIVPLRDKLRALLSKIRK